MPEAFALEFTDPSGEPLRIEWSEAALAALDPAAPDQGPVWSLGGELDWDEVESLRVLSGRLDDGRLLAIAALRPAGAEGHGDELIAGVIGEPGTLRGLAESLLSTEYGEDETPTRIGLELHSTEGGIPERIAGDATANATDRAGALRRVSTALALRAGDTPGVAVLDALCSAR